MENSGGIIPMEAAHDVENSGATANNLKKKLSMESPAKSFFSPNKKAKLMV